MDEYILYAVVTVVIFTAYMAVVNIFRRDRMRERIQGRGTAGMLASDEKAPPAFAVFCEKLVGNDGKQDKELSMALAQAGIGSPYAVAYCRFVKKFVQPVLLVMGGALFVRMLLAANMTTSGKLLTLIGGLFSLIAGVSGVNIYLKNARQHRQKILIRSFPEALDLMLICIESGLGLDATLGRVCNELKVYHPIITGELERTRLELTMLNDRTQALQNLGDRTGIVPFKALVSSLIQTEKFGTSLVDTLRVLSEDQRVTRLMDAENRAARIPVLITVPIILFIFLPFFLLIILGPPIVRVIEQGGLFGHTVAKSSDK